MQCHITVDSISTTRGIFQKDFAGKSFFIYSKILLVENVRQKKMSDEHGDDKLTYEDFLNWTLTTLKDYLGICGLKQTGPKAGLVARAFGAYELNAPKKFTQEQISEKIKQEYNKRLQINKISSDPNSLPDEAWKDNVADWPQLDDDKLFSHILKIKAVDVDYIGKY